MVATPTLPFTLADEHSQAFVAPDEYCAALARSCDEYHARFLCLLESDPGVQLHNNIRAVESSATNAALWTNSPISIDPLDTTAIIHPALVVPDSFGDNESGVSPAAVSRADDQVLHGHGKRGTALPITSRAQKPSVVHHHKAKQPFACLFCRERKISCKRPPGVNNSATCK